jgi:predicted RNA-binding protein
MIVQTEENFAVTAALGFSTAGTKTRHRRKAERMQVGDRIVYYLSDRYVFPATATVVSTFYEDHRPIWKSHEARPETYPWRVSTRPDYVLEAPEWLDAYQLAPRLMYVKRWPAELWPLAFQGNIHLLSSQDFRLIEGEMDRIVQMRGRRRERPPRRPPAPSEPPEIGELALKAD